MKFVLGWIQRLQNLPPLNACDTKNKRRRKQVSSRKEAFCKWTINTFCADVFVFGWSCPSSSQGARVYTFSARGERSLMTYTHTFVTRLAFYHLLSNRCSFVLFIHRFRLCSLQRSKAINNVNCRLSTKICLGEKEVNVNMIFKFRYSIFNICCWC